jgi:uncharacterized membrane protein YdjX (TVP38/TMEM64 family)
MTKHLKILRGISILMILLFGSIILLYLLQTKGSDIVIQVIREQGLLGQAIYVLYIVAAVMFSPLNSVVIKPVVLVSYGFWTAVFLAFVGSMIGGTINYLLAKTYGRKIIKKLTGEEVLKKVDAFSKIAGWQSFLFLRVIGVNFYDYISYAAGIADINLRTFLLVTTPVNLVWKIIAFYIIDKALILKDLRAIILLAVVWTLSLLAGVRILKKHGKKKAKN